MIKFFDNLFSILLLISILSVIFIPFCLEYFLQILNKVHFRNSKDNFRLLLNTGVMQLDFYNKTILLHFVNPNESQATYIKNNYRTLFIFSIREISFALIPILSIIVFLLKVI